MSMMATEKGIFALSVLCLVVSTAVCLQVTIPQSSYEFARGDNITLPCTFVPKNPTNSLVIITWSAKANNLEELDHPIVTYYSTEATLDVNSEYHDRADLDYDIPKGKANLILKNINLQDNRMFECQVSIPRDDEGVLLDTTRLVVLVAPSPPVCLVQGTAEYGQNINLTCASAEGSPTPVYTWERRDVSNVVRPQDARTTVKNGLLSLFNVSIDTSGYYICTSSNKIRSAKCNVTLSVMPQSLKIGSTAGIIGGVVAGLILLVIIICCCCRMKKNKEKEEFALGVPDDEAFSDEDPQVRGGEARPAERPRDEAEPRDQYDKHSEREHDRRSDYDDRRSDYDDRRSDYDDRRSDFDDRRSDYTDRRSDYTDRRGNYDDDRSDRRDRHDDRNDRNRDYDDRGYDDRYDDRPPRVPANKPIRKDNDH